MEKPRKYGIAVSDLPEGAIGMPEVIFEDNVEFEEIRQQVLEQKDGSGDERGPERRY